MADATSFYRNLIAATQTYINALQALQTFQDRLASDANLSTAAAAAAQAAGRNDLAKADFDNVAAAIVQFAFTFNSGAPTQKSFLYKLL